ncbi:MAG: riboflavin kinase [Parvularculaceae bacterium]
MTLGELIHPRNGVYATRATVDGKTYDAVSNFGRRPTVESGGAGAPLLETYLFDFSGDLYGKDVEVAFIAFRRTSGSSTGSTLKAQIAADSAEARTILGRKG